MPLRIRKGNTPEDVAACYRVRHAVFIGEQNVDPDLGSDEADATATHFLATHKGIPIGAVRVVLIDGRSHGHYWSRLRFVELSQNGHWKTPYDSHRTILDIPARRRFFAPCANACRPLFSRNRLCACG
jgi:hypothetical protein